MKAVNPWLLPSVLKLWASNGPRSWWGIVSVLVWLGSCKKKQKQWIWLKNTCVFCKFYSYTFGCAKGMTFIHQGDNLHHTSFSCHASHARHANHAKMHWSVDLEFRHESLVHKSVTSVACHCYQSVSSFPLPSKCHGTTFLKLPPKQTCSFFKARIFEDQSWRTSQKEENT